MTAPRRRSDRIALDDWAPQPWDRSTEARTRNAELRGPQKPIIQAESPDLKKMLRDQALPVAAAYGIIGGLAALFAFAPDLPSIGQLSMAMLILIISAVAGLVFVRSRSTRFVSATWVATAVTICLLLPLAVIQVTLLREPFVSVEFGSARPAFLATLVTVLATIAFAAACAVAASETPENAGLLFLPAALQTSVVLSAPEGFRIDWAIGSIGLVFLFSAAAMLCSVFVGPGVRLLIPAIWFAVLILVLLAIGRGPVTEATSGGIVRFLYVLTLAVVIGMLVLVPILAVWLRRMRGGRDARQLSQR